MVCGIQATIANQQNPRGSYAGCSGEAAARGKCSERRRFHVYRVAQTAGGAAINHRKISPDESRY